MSSKKNTTVRFPSKILQPVSDFLYNRLKQLQKRKKELTKEDPFSDESRVTDNAAPDIEADEQSGHARTSALKDQVNRSIIQTRKALATIKLGKYGVCQECGQMIDTDRLMAYPEATFCAKDAAKREE